MEAFGYSRVAINQSTEDFNCANDLLYPYLLRCQELMAKFRFVQLTWIPRESNMEANKLAQVAFGYAEQDDDVCVDVMPIDTNDWRADLLNYLRDPARGADKKTRHRALKHVLIGDELYFRTMEGLLLKCLGPTEALKVMHDVHEGVCGTHNRLIK